MGKFSDYFQRRSGGEETNDRNNSFGGEEYEYYEDTHNENGDYTSKLRNFQRESFDRQPAAFSSRESFDRSEPEPSRQFRSTYVPPQPTVQPQYVPPQPVQYQQTVNTNPQGFMVYTPKTADDVQTVIDFLKLHKSAIVNLDDVEETVSQRVLDFVSGAIYALNGSVHRVAGNIFLLSPEGVGITDVGEMKK